MFQQKVAIVTGGANGIGRCIVESFAAKGCYTAFLDTDSEAGKRLLARLPGTSEHHLFFSGDAGKKEHLENFAQQVIRKFGEIDFLINNVCFSRKGILSGCSYEDFCEVLNAGVAAPYFLAKLFRSRFRKGAAIVNIGSTRAFLSQKDTESYTAAKGGITALTHALAMSLSGVARVNCISPGWIDTGAYHDDDYEPAYSPADMAQHPSGLVGVPHDIARAVLFLCAPDSDFINGENLTIDGGMTKRMIYAGDEGWNLSSPVQN